MDSATRLNFLRDSAKFLECQSPSTASHLMSVHTQILHEDGKSLKPRQHEFFCSACGSLRNPGCKKMIVRGASGEDKPLKKLSRGGGGTDLPREAIVYTCLRCHRRKIQPLEQPARQHNSLKQLMNHKSSFTPSLLSSSSSPLSESPASSGQIRPMVENSNSKKRAKARKQGSLQVLLASKRIQAPSNSSSSLDLLDFLQQ
ncbi:cullin binding protein CanA [Elaphomyces granulatus]